jgi:membrane protease YdiL (CAAX protease family)
MEENNLIADFKPVKRYFSRIGLSCSLLMLVTVVIQYLAVQIIRLTAPEFTESDWFVWVVTSLPLYIFAFPIYLYTLPKPIDKPVTKSKINVKEFLMFLLMCFGVMYPLNFAGYGLTEALKSIFHIAASNPLESAMSMSNIYVTFIFAVLLAPVMEELIFRKLLIDRIGRIDKRTALFFSALAFGLFHGNFYQFFYAYGLGLLFGYIYIKTGRIRYSIGLHMLINFLGTVVSQTVLKYANTDALLNTATDQIDVINNMLASLPSLMAVSVYGLALLAMVTAGIYLLVRERRRFRVAEPDDAIPDERAFSIVYMTWGVAAFIIICAVLFVLNLAVAV